MITVYIQFIFQTTPAVVGYDPANYGTQGQTQTKGHYPQGQSGPEGQPDIPPKQDYPMESDPQPSYDEVDKHWWDVNVDIL